MIEYRRSSAEQRKLFNPQLNAEAAVHEPLSYTFTFYRSIEGRAERRKEERTNERKKLRNKLRKEK